MPPTQKEVPQSAFASIEDKLTDDVIDAVLERKKDQITENDITYLEELKKSREEEHKEKEEVREIAKDKQLVLTKPSKKAAYVDTVILCLLSQLAIFALLIFVLLLIK